MGECGSRQLTQSFALSGAADARVRRGRKTTMHDASTFEAQKELYEHSVRGRGGGSDAQRPQAGRLRTWHDDDDDEGWPRE